MPAMRAVLTNFFPLLLAPAPMCARKTVKERLIRGTRQHVVDAVRDFAVAAGRASVATTTFTYTSQHTLNASSDGRIAAYAA